MHCYALNDIPNDLFSAERAAPKYYDQLLQSIYLDRILSLSSLNKTTANAKALVENAFVITDDDNCFDIDDLVHPSSRDLYFRFMTIAF